MKWYNIYKEPKVQENGISSLYDYYSLGVPNSPREWIWVPPHYNDYLVVGTSFAAPQVTGAIALMMEYKPSLVFYPQEAMALLVAGVSTTDIVDLTYFYDLTDMINGVDELDNSGLTSEAGAGLMDLAKTFEVIEIGNVYSNTTTRLASGLVKTMNIYLHYNDHIRVAFSYLRNQNENNLYDNSDYDLEIWNIEDVLNPYLVLETSSTISTLELGEFIVPESGEYLIKIYLRARNAADSEMTYYSYAIYSSNGYYIYNFPSSCWITMWGGIYEKNN